MIWETQNRRLETGIDMHPWTYKTMSAAHRAHTSGRAELELQNLWSHQRNIEWITGHVISGQLRIMYLIGSQMNISEQPPADGPIKAYFHTEERLIARLSISQLTSRMWGNGSRTCSIASTETKRQRKRQMKHNIPETGVRQRTLSIAAFEPAWPQAAVHTIGGVQ